MKENNLKIFVYGTLRKEQVWHHLLKDSYFIEKAITKNKYALYLDNIPYVMENEKVSFIVGELYEVSEKTLAAVDKLEGHPNWYTRKEIKVYIENEEIMAWIYFFPKANGKKIISGDYFNYKLAKTSI